MTEPKTNTYMRKGRRELGFPRGATALLVIDPVKQGFHCPECPGGYAVSDLIFPLWEIQL